jgi:hypothetical protein
VQSTVLEQVVDSRYRHNGRRRRWRRRNGSWRRINTGRCVALRRTLAVEYRRWLRSWTRARDPRARPLDVWLYRSNGCSIGAAVAEVLSLSFSFHIWSLLPHRLTNRSLWSSVGVPWLQRRCGSLSGLDRRAFRAQVGRTARMSICARNFWLQSYPNLAISITGRQPVFFRDCLDGDRSCLGRPSTEILLR